MNEYIGIMNAYDDNGGYVGSYNVRLLANTSKEARFKFEKYMAKYNVETDEGIEMKYCNLERRDDMKIIGDVVE